MTNSTNIQIINNQPVVSSLDIAAAFGKEHYHVIRDIRSIIADIIESNFGFNSAINQSNFGCVSKNNNLSVMFKESTYKDAKGESRPCYLLNRDAFSLIAMGFTGRKALEWKLKYIAAFNAMEEKLKNSPKAKNEAIRYYEEQGKIKLLIEMICFVAHYNAKTDTMNLYALLEHLKDRYFQGMPLMAASRFPLH